MAMLVEECAAPESRVERESARMCLIDCKALSGCYSVIGCDFAHGMLVEHFSLCRSVIGCDVSLAWYFCCWSILRDAIPSSGVSLALHGILLEHSS
jgi:hypothetical protein